VGFDDAAKGLGRVDCRVFADGKELYSNPDLQASGAPVPLKLSVAGADQLRLLVDFGRGQDTGDRVIWANARLFRPSPKTAAKSDPAPDSTQPILGR
jgi:NPCBM/NEW2 domain